MTGQHIQQNPDASTVTYDEAIQAATELFFGGDPVQPGNEYLRGVCNLIAEMFGEFEVFTSDRMEQVRADIAKALPGYNIENASF